MARKSPEALERGREYNRAYYAANKDYFREKFGKWQQNNRETRTAYAKEWSRNHADEINARRNTPEAKKRRSKYYKENILPKRRQQRRADKEKVNAQNRARYAANPEESKAYSRRASQIRRARRQQVQLIPFTPEQWAAKVAYWGDRCYICNGPWSAQDHVKPISAGGGHMLCNVRPICKPDPSTLSDLDSSQYDGVYYE